MISASSATAVATGAALLVGAALIALPSVAPMPEERESAAPQAPAIDGLNPTPGRYVSAWLPYWKADEGLPVFVQNADLFTDLTTFFHYVTGPDGSLVNRSAPGRTEAAIEAARGQGLPVLAAVLDDSGRGTMREILLEPGRRAAHIQQLLVLVDQVGYDGIDIDYENFAFVDGQDTWPAARDGWVAFITELGAELRARGKYLTVAAPPQFDGERTDRSGYWVYDWPAIAPSIDLLRVMTYDYSTDEPGPVGPLPWVRRTTEFGVSVFGGERFRIGIPTYGRDWVRLKSGEGCGLQRLSGSVTRSASELIAIAEASGAAISFDEETAEAAFAYTQGLPGCVVERWVRFQDAAAVRRRAELALANGSGVALWSLGGEDPSIWETLRNARPPQPEPAPSP